MFEIELKAHVQNRQTVITQIERFAHFLGAVHKSDTYYQHGDGKKCRIRKEVPFTAPELTTPPDVKAAPSFYFTYKKKELRADEAGVATEVNDEKECTLSDCAPIESYLRDNGFSVALTKEKSVLGWQYERVHIELCTVPPLGDFLELETFAEADDEATTENAKQQLTAVLKKAGLREADIENRYYSELLRKAQGENYV